MSYENHVVIGPEFFAKAFNDYSNWRWAVAREFCQNSIDCGSRNINITISYDSTNDSTTLVVENDGEPMTREILTSKLLALGGSGKNFHNTVGGFGKAKEILYFAHRSYNIETGNLIVEGSGAGYNIAESPVVIYGTRSTVVISSDYSESLSKAFEAFANYAQWPGTLKINGVHYKTELRKGSPRRDLGFAKVYTNKAFSNRLIVRINGTPMFNEYISWERCVIVELDGSSVETLTSNRDGLNYKYRHQLTDFINELAVDKKSAMKDKSKTRYQHFCGTKMTHSTRNGVTITMPIPSAALQTVDPYIAETTACSYIPAYSRECSSQVSPPSIGLEFVVKNETDLSIPAYYLPGSGEFSEYSAKLSKYWSLLVLELHRLFDYNASFAIGFIFDDTTVAQFEAGQYGNLYLINPVRIVGQGGSNSRSMKKRFKLTERNRLLVIALHEFVHGLGYRHHDENYSSIFTDMASVVMDNRQLFNKCFV